MTALAAAAPPGPYSASAAQYLEFGWAPIPLPPRKKLPPPKDWTGASREHSGEMPPIQQVERWMVAQGNGNVALRLMDGYIAIDVDVYHGGGKTLALAEERWGKLPSSFMSSARADGSGCRIYKVPRGLKWPGNFKRILGEGIDVVAWTHRYVIAFPSMHPELKERYLWRDTDSFEPLEDEDGQPWAPETADVVELPTSWVEGLSLGKWVGFNSVNLGDDEASMWLDDRNNEEVCSALDAVLTRWQGKVMAAGAASGVHDETLAGCWALLRESFKGHSGIKKVLARLKKTYAVAMSNRDPARAKEAGSEWKRLVFQGVQKLAAEKEPPSSRDACDSTPAANAKAIGTSGGKIILGNVPDSIGELGKALRFGALPETYARRGEFVRLRASIGEDGIQALQSYPFDVDSLRLELALHCKVVAPKFDKAGELESFVDKSPTVEVLKSVLKSHDWSPLPVLRGIVKQPLFRPDGSILQDPGYDSATGLWYEPSSTASFRKVPSSPDPLQVASARLWLIDSFLRDFPWTNEADMANYLALLVTPLIRAVIGAQALSPLGVVSATAPGSGKSLLALDIPRAIYRLTSYAWKRREEERHKDITTAFAHDSQVVVFDNVGDHDRVDSPALAKLLTSVNWDDRRMGKNTEVLSYLNNRLWMATGNNISLGGDIASRTVLVRLNPLLERPQSRSASGFAVGDLLEWLDVPANVEKLLWALMLLAADWVGAGAPREEFAMRGFTQWASALGGFLKHHSIPGFLANASALAEADSEEEEWGSFLADLRERLAGGKTPMGSATAAEIHAMYVGMFGMEEANVPLPARADGSAPNVRGLGVMLQKRIDRFFNGLTIAGDKENNTRRWRVLTREERIAESRQGTSTPG